VAAPSWQTPDDVQRRLRRRWERQRGEWLGGGGVWPQFFALGAPNEHQASADWAGFQAWLSAWRDSRLGELAERRERRWPMLGVQDLPQRLVISGPGEFAETLGEAQRWGLAEERWQRLVRAWPRLTERLRRHFGLLADYPDDEFDRLVNVFAWLCANPGSGLSLRQLPVPGVHSKWVEARQGVLADWLAVQLGTEPAELHCLAGLRSEPERLRMRMLDPALRAAVGGLNDLSVPVAEAAALGLPVARAVVVENLQTGLAFEDLPGTVVIMGLGYAVDLLARIPWLVDVPLRYWGDIDTHGYAILHRLRAYLPHARSLLMDEATLLAHRELCSVEASPARATQLSHLTAEEQRVYSGLRDGRWGVGIRLEQERVAWPYAWARIVGEV
jgi:hypothetical protein